MLLSQCSESKVYGTDFDVSKAIAIDEALIAFKSGDAKSKIVKGEISAVCQSEGCWFNYKTKDGDVMVDFDHKFTIPKDCKGKMAMAEGSFSYDTTSVEKLKDWAKDDNKSQEEIDKITSPKIKLLFNATGFKFAK